MVYNIIINNKSIKSMEVEKKMKKLLKQAMNVTNRINAMEDKIAKEWYGCSWDELEYDDKELVTYEAYDRLNK